MKSMSQVLKNVDKEVLIKGILQRVVNCMERDYTEKEDSEYLYKDNGNFVLSLSEDQFRTLLYYLK